ncbi:MAG: MSMEG_4193 family putative phosphomutase [Anaerolineales bacterium]
MTMILLIRHGENDYVKLGRLAGRLPGVDLNQTGLIQAKMLADKLASAPIKAIYTSPLERAMQTAQPLAEANQKEMVVRESLLEIDYGDWQGRTLKSLRRNKLWKVVQTQPSRARFPGGESFAEAQQRICHEVENLANTHDEKDLLLCFSHADMIKLALAYYMGIPLDLFQRLVVSPCSISTLYIGKHGVRLIALNIDVFHTIIPD